MKKILPILIAILIIGCSQESNLISITIDNNQCTIELDGDMSPMMERDRNEDASLQYANIFREKYIMIISEGDEYNTFWNNQDSLIYYEIDNISNPFEAYSNIIIDDLEHNYQSEADVSECLINGMTAKKVSIDGTFDGIEISWTTFLINGKYNFYQICVWTTLDNKLEYLPKLEKMAQTFKEI